MLYVLFSDGGPGLSIQPVKSIRAFRVTWDNGVRRGWCPLWRAQGIFPSFEMANDARQLAKRADDLVAAKMVIKTAPGYKHPVECINTME